MPEIRAGSGKTHLFARKQFEAPLQKSVQVSHESLNRFIFPGIMCSMREQMGHLSPTAQKEDM